MRRILHTMLRVGDLRRSIDFYTHILGMEELRRFDQPEEQYTLVFLGYEEESKSGVLELTYNYGVTEYTIGNAYGHIAIGVQDLYQVVSAIKERGGQLSLEPVKLKGGDEMIAFISDPDGYQIELIERPESWLLKV